MKILKPGRKQKGWAKEYKCDICDNNVLVTYNDLYKEYMYLNETESIVFRCKICNYTNYVNEEVVLKLKGAPQA